MAFQQTRACYVESFGLPGSYALRQERLLGNGVNRCIRRAAAYTSLERVTFVDEVAFNEIFFHTIAFQSLLPNNVILQADMASPRISRCDRSSLRNVTPEGLYLVGS